jgi:predicted GH43/DUF377 family glycosyl hydrolase
MKAKRTNVIILPNNTRVLLRPFDLTKEERSIKVIRRILSLSNERVEEELTKVLSGYKERHRNLKAFLLKRYEEKMQLIPSNFNLNEAQKLLIGSYFTSEYSLESAALFNPSMVWHPDQSGLSSGSQRFIISLRATGEGHISSIAFRSGVIDSNLNITLDEISQFVTAPEMHMMGVNYEVRFDPDLPISERVLFPSTTVESNGMEDARFVEFQDEAGPKKYLATYTAYDGMEIHARLLATDDFLHFKSESLMGSAIENKGLALFPRKVNGLHVMLSRQDNENNYIMFSEKLRYWESKKILLEPAESWDFIQVGNCGSPLETEAGWLVLSHGVGPMRRYVISAFLLDLEDPTKVIGRLKQPLLVPNENEREGYVPNVVYSCGSQMHNGHLIIPYAMSDYASSLATVELNELLNELTSSFI